MSTLNQVLFLRKYFRHFSLDSSNEIEIPTEIAIVRNLLNLLGFSCFAIVICVGETVEARMCKNVEVTV